MLWRWYRGRWVEKKKSERYGILKAQQETERERERERKRGIDILAQRKGKREVRKREREREREKERKETKRCLTRDERECVKEVRSMI